MVEVKGKLEGVTASYLGKHLMHGVVVDGLPRWNVLDVAQILFAPLGTSVEEFADLLTGSIEPDELYVCELKNVPTPFLGASCEQIESFILECDIDYGGFLGWLAKLDRKTQDRMMSDGDDYIEGYLTPEFAAFVRHTLENMAR